MVTYSYNNSRIVVLSFLPAAIDRFGSEAVRSSPSEAATVLQEEIGPAVYSQTIADMQNRLQLRVSEWNLEVREKEFPNRPNYAN
jgi:hypothetical protein